MANTIEVDLSTVLESVLDSGHRLVPNRSSGCLAQIGISTEEFAAFLAEDLSAIANIIRPCDQCATAFAMK